MEIEVAVAERGGITSMRQTVGDESTYTVVKGDVAYVFDMLSPYYIRVSTAELELELTADDNTRFVAEGREAIDGKTYDFVIRESLEDSSQHLTYFFDGDTLFAIRATVRMDSVTMNVLFRVPAFTDEIPEDMPFEVPQGYTEYVEEPYEAPEFRRNCPNSPSARFTASPPPPRSAALSTSSPSAPTATRTSKRSRPTASGRSNGRKAACSPQAGTAFW
ncbi:MAG: hypothetical protein ACLUFV_07030 [Acutalibacteraceae bacterium]